MKKLMIFLIPFFIPLQSMEQVNQKPILTQQAQIIGSPCLANLPAALQRLILPYLPATGDSLKESVSTIKSYLTTNKHFYELFYPSRASEDERKEILQSITITLANRWLGGDFAAAANQLMVQDPISERSFTITESLKLLQGKYRILEAHIKNKKPDPKQKQAAITPEEKKLTFIMNVQECLAQKIPLQDLIQLVLERKPEHTPEEIERKKTLLSHMEEAGITQEAIDLERKYLEFRAAILANDSLEVGAYINEGIDLQRPILYQTPLMIATSIRASGIVNNLLLAGACVNKTGGKEDSALGLALDKAFLEIVELLIQGGARVNHQTTQGQTPLMRAAEFNPIPNPNLDGDYSVSEASDVESSDTENGQRPARQKYINDGAPKEETETEQFKKCVEALLKAGALVNAKDNDGNTALMIATHNDLPHMVQQLLAANADPTIRNKKGKTARDLAKKYKHYEIAEKIKMAEKALALAQQCKIVTSDDEQSEDLAGLVSDHDSVLSDTHVSGLGFIYDDESKIFVEDDTEFNIENSDDDLELHYIHESNDEKDYVPKQEPVKEKKKSRRIRKVRASAANKNYAEDSSQEESLSEQTTTSEDEESSSYSSPKRRPKKKLKHR